MVSAVQCAVEIQDQLTARNADLPDNRKMAFRIGVNLGDVIQSGDAIYGDGVNIAARIEALAEAGGVSISRTVFSNVQNKLRYGYEYQGEHQVKNITNPVRVYKLLTAPEDAGKLVGDEPKVSASKWIWPTVVAAAILLTLIGYHVYQKMAAPEFEPASVEKMAYPLPEKPSIAVLAFDNMSDDPTQEYFSDGISEDIITVLSKTDQLFVIARNSTFTYKGKSTSVKQVAEELGVRYVLEGSVRKSEDRVRITAQLIDAVKGTHLWAERYDRDLKDLFALQDELTMKIVTALQVKLTEGEQARLMEEKVKSIDLKLKVMELVSLWRKGTKESLVRFGQLAQEVIDTAPDSPVGYEALSWYYWWFAMGGKSPQESIAKAFKFAQQALSIGKSDSGTHALLGSVYLLMRQYDKAIAEGELSIELDPNGSLFHGLLGITLSYADRVDEGIDHLKQGIRLDPFPPYWFYHHLGRCYMQKGQYVEALKEFEKALHLSPDARINHMYLAAVYVLLNRQEEAEAAAKKVLEIDPGFSVERTSKAWPYKNPAEVKLEVDALCKAGLPYTPPLPLPDKPSIAVLAFDNMSGNPEQEYFSDGIAENIITALSKVGQLFVIARNSSFTYKGKPVKVQQVGRELGVRYVLEGSVRKSGDRVRITAQLIDAIKGQHLWGEDYDRDFENILDIQDNITKKIVTALRIDLTEGEQARIIEKQYKSLDAYLKGLRWQSFWNKGTEEGNIRAGQLAQEIIDAEPESPVGYRMMSLHHYHLANMGRSVRENAKKAYKLSQKALTLDESDPYSHATLGWIYLLMRQYEKAIESGERSVELAPSMAVANFLLGSTLSYADRIDEGIDYLKRAIRLNPFPAFYYYHHLGRSYWQKGQYKNALAEYKKALQRAPDSPLNHFSLAIALISLDREEEARVSAGKALELLPSMSVAFASNLIKFKNKDTTNRMLDAMRKAGFPE